MEQAKELLEEAKITGVHNSNERLSSNVFNIISEPIPLRSPTDIPTFIVFSFFTKGILILTRLYKLSVFLSLTLRCKFNHYKIELCLLELLKI